MKRSYRIFATLVVVVGYLSSPLVAREGKSFDLRLQHVSGQSATASNALGMEGARSINNIMNGGLSFQSITTDPTFSGLGFSLGLSNDALTWGWKLNLDFADLSASKSEIASQDYSTLSMSGISIAITSNDILSFSSNKLQKLNLGYTADIYAFRSSGAALQKLGIRVGGRLRSDDLKLSDSLVFTGATMVINGATTNVPMDINFLNIHKLNYQEHALELLAGISYQYDVTASTQLDVAASAIYGKGVGKYKHDATVMTILMPSLPPMPSTNTFKGDTKLTRTGFLAELGILHNFNDKYGLRLFYGLSQIQSTVDESNVKNPNASPLIGLLTGNFSSYIADSTDPMGSNPAKTDREQRIGLEFKIGL